MQTTYEPSMIVINSEMWSCIETFLSLLTTSFSYEKYFLKKLDISTIILRNY